MAFLCVLHRSSSHRPDVKTEDKLCSMNRAVCISTTLAYKTTNDRTGSGNPSSVTPLQTMVAELCRWETQILLTPLAAPRTLICLLDAHFMGCVEALAGTRAYQKYHTLSTHCAVLATVCSVTT